MDALALIAFERAGGVAQLTRSEMKGKTRMAYESLSEIYATIDETRERLFERMAQLSAGQPEESSRDGAGGWSVTEIVEHLCIIEENIVRLAGMMLKKAEAEDAPARTDGRIEPVSLDKIIERSSREKYQAPETVRPRGDVSIADSLERMRATRQKLHEMRPRLEARDLAQFQYPHPMFGPLNVYEWLVMIGIHEQRHLRQIDGLLSS